MPIPSIAREVYLSLVLFLANRIHVCENLLKISLGQIVSPCSQRGMAQSTHSLITNWTILLTVTYCKVHLVTLTLSKSRRYSHWIHPTLSRFENGNMLTHKVTLPVNRWTYTLQPAKLTNREIWQLLSGWKKVSLRVRCILTLTQQWTEEWIMRRVIISLSYLLSPFFPQ